MDQRVPRPPIGPQAAALPRPVPMAQMMGFTLTPKEAISILRRHILMIISLTTLGLIAGGASWYLVLRYAPKYTARTYIRVLPPAEKDPMQIGGVIVNKDIQYAHRQSIASLIRQQSTLMDLLERDRIKQTKWFKQFGTETNRAQGIRKALDDLDENLSVVALRDAEFVAISMTCSDSKEAALIVNELVDLFLTTYRGSKTSEVRNRLAELQERRSFIESELAAAEAALDEVRRTFGFTDLDVHNFEDTITLRLNALDQEENDLRLTVSQLQANIANLERIAQGPINEQIENAVERDPTMIFLTQQLFSRKTQLAAALTKFGENHRTVRELQELIEDLQRRRNIRKQEIGEQIRQANLKDATDQLAVFRSRLEEAERQRQQAAAEKRRLDLARVEYQKRIRIRDQLQEMLNDIKEHIEKLRIMAEDPETAKVMPVAPALEPLEVSSPLWYVYFPAGTFLGFSFGIGLAFLLELLNDLLRTPRDVTRFVEAPLLGVIPHYEEDHQTRKIDPYHLTRLAPYSILSEAYRRLHVNLKLSKNIGSNKVIFVSSCGPGDGKTAVSINLATTLVAEGKKVLLVDTNLWQPMLYKKLPQQGTTDSEPAKPDIGLSTFLTGQNNIEQIIRPTTIENLDVIDAGPLPSNPSELLARSNMAELLNAQKDNYDYIILDGPPILLVSGAKALAGYADGTLLVFNADLTRRGAAQRAVRELREINASVIGCVLLAARSLKGGYFQEQFRSYQRYQAAPVAAS